jgi:hypothetical protein
METKSPSFPDNDPAEIDLILERLRIEVALAEQLMPGNIKKSLENLASPVEIADQANPVALRNKVKTIRYNSTVERISYNIKRRIKNQPIVFFSYKLTASILKIFIRPITR